MNLIYKFFESIDKFMTPDHSIGLLLYFSGSVTVLLFEVFYLKGIIEDIKLSGTSRKWESPEVVKMLFILLFPHIIMADAWLGLSPSEGGWLFILILAIFTIADRWGLVWLSSFRTKTTLVEKQTLETDETKISKESTTINSDSNPPPIN